jgi:hypothetical protein
MEGESARVSRASECELDLKTTDEPQSSSARVASIDAPVDATHYKCEVVEILNPVVFRNE